MDINDISINSLIRDAGQLTGFEWSGFGSFTAHCDGLMFEVDTYERNISIRTDEVMTRTLFKHICPKQFEAFLDGLKWDFEEEQPEEEAA